MRINKWIPIVLAINIGVLCFALYVATTYQQQNYIVSCEQPITNYSILEVNCRGHRMHSTVKIAYAGKDYYGRTGNFPWIAPAPLTKYLSTTEHEERQVTDSMHLCSQPLYL